jgi:hypothetical protein
MSGRGRVGGSSVESRFLDIFQRVYPNEKTRRNYIARLEALLRNVNADTLLEILVAPDTWYPKLQTAYPSLTTRKNVLTPILVLFREDKDLSAEHGDAGKRWKKLHDDLGKHQEARVKRSEPDAKQLAKYTSYEEIEEKYESLRKESPHKTQRASLKYVLLSVLVHLRPKRADLGAVQIYYNTDPADTEKNYLVLRDEGVSFLALNLYKTSKHYQTVEEDLPEGLVRDIRSSLRRWPRSYLFVSEGGDPMSNNTYSQFVKRTFEELFGRGTGVSLLRHIYITEKLNFDDMTLEEQEEEARLMMHTSGLQRRYKWTKKSVCPKLCTDYIRRQTKRARRVRGRRSTRRQKAGTLTSNTE